MFYISEYLSFFPSRISEYLSKMRKQINTNVFKNYIGSVLNNSVWFRFRFIQGNLAQSTTKDILVTLQNDNIRFPSSSTSQMLTIHSVLRFHRKTLESFALGLKKLSFKARSYCIIFEGIIPFFRQQILRTESA